MITIFCTFFTLLTCVSGVTVLTQSPLITASKGQTAKLDCNLGTVTNDAARWYKQTPGGVPQYVLIFYHGWSSVSYGSGFSAPKFTSTHSSQSDYSLIINNVDVDDSAVYYCYTWDGSVSEGSLSSLYENLILSDSLHLFTKLNLLITVKMLIIFYCIILTLLSSVRCVKVVTQKPPILTEQKGRSVTMDCNIEKDESYYVNWYKQIPNAAPQFVLRYYHSHSSPDKYGDGFTSSRFTSKAQSKIDYQLIISNVDVDDSAVYYCGTWDNTANEEVSQ
ncbi:Immunoglobulin light [Labeo rohita]|nr:Immunoglobulin light [Labeo rohita]